MKLSVRTGLGVLLAAGMAMTMIGGAGAAARENVLKSGQKSVTTLATGASGWAVVDSDGTLSRKLNAKSVTHTPGAANYTVLFNSNVRGCVYTGSVGLSGSASTSGPGYITVVGAASSTRGVYVNTYDGTGAAVERPFHLLVTC